MALFKKTVFNMTQVENESLSDMVHSCLVHFGKCLYSAEKERLEHETHNQEPTDDIAKTILINFDCMFGKHISLNTNYVTYEEDRLLQDETVLPVISNIYMIEELGKVVDWSRVDKEDYLLAMERSPIKNVEIRELLKQALTSDIDNREVYMKGIDTSYSYEGYFVYKIADL